MSLCKNAIGRTNIDNEKKSNVKQLTLKKNQLLSNKKKKIVSN